MWFCKEDAELSSGLSQSRGMKRGLTWDCAALAELTVGSQQIAEISEVLLCSPLQDL